MSEEINAMVGYKCPHCEDLYLDETDALYCCCSHEVDVFQCTECEELYTDEETALNCCR